MFYVYVLKSKDSDRFYVGFANNLRERIKKHNKGEVYWTKRHMPWKLAYYEAYLSRDDARDREKQLKRFAKAFGQLKRRAHRTLIL